MNDDNKRACDAIRAHFYGKNINETITITRRDYFAGLAMQEILRHAFSLSGTVSIPQVAIDAYKMADKMLEFGVKHGN